ncbi:hypothetical protein, partial [Ruminococcus sp.]|uniref:hypothetical protein n=1 Tax=Ruminococcus sp. TaxID=41978 RepID=UPI003F0BCA89
ACKATLLPYLGHFYYMASIQKSQAVFMPLSQNLMHPVILFRQKKRELRALSSPQPPFVNFL